MTFVVSSVLLGMLGLASAASAQSGGTRAECRGMKNMRACSCALNNGGSISADRHRPGKVQWQAARKGTPAHMAFMNCTNRSGA